MNTTATAPIPIPQMSIREASNLWRNHDQRPYGPDDFYSEPRLDTDKGDESDVEGEWEMQFE